MFLYVLRHGDAVQNSSLHDSERPLSDLGKLQAEAAGRFLRSSNIRVDRILSSPLIRAVETATIVQKALNLSYAEQSEYLVPGTRKNELFELINSKNGNSILLAGHEPHLSETVSLLLTGREDLPLQFRKCSLACLVASEPVRAGHAALQWLVTTEQMQLLRREGLPSSR